MVKIRAAQLAMEGQESSQQMCGTHKVIALRRSQFLRTLPQQYMPVLELPAARKTHQSASQSSYTVPDKLHMELPDQGGKIAGHIAMWRRRGISAVSSMTWPVLKRLQPQRQLQPSWLILSSSISLGSDYSRGMLLYSKACTILRPEAHGQNSRPRGANLILNNDGKLTWNPF